MGAPAGQYLMLVFKIIAAGLVAGNAPAQYQHPDYKLKFFTPDQDKIVDRLGYWDQVQDYFKSQYHGWNPVSLNRYRGFLKGKVIVIPGLMNKIAVQSLRISPRAAVRRITRKLQET